ncbi:MAG: phosphatase PAP2 family protein [Scytonema hyalinum WJT4-NPBG1]|jgi:undecaprenyl-diphosphatase|nr:phosphatase PAP2 family protein [Scytonema hyalinum WJT4-NPBG1]
MGTPNFNQLRNENPLVRAIHTAVKGRARYKVSGLHYSEDLKRYLESRLSEEEIIAQVHANHITGNVLVIFHPEKSPNAIALLLQDIVLDYRKQVRKLPVTTAYISTAKETAKNLPINKGELNQPKADADKQNGKALLPQTHTNKQLDQASNQLVLVSGVVSSLVLCTAVLHKYNLDTSILLAIQKLHTPLLDRIMLGITSLGDPTVLLLVSLGLGFGLIYHNRRFQATTLGIAVGGAILLNCLLKLLFGRARPALWDRLIHVGLHSFPSGHAMVSIVIYGFIGYILAKQFPQWRGRIFALTFVLILAIGFSRLYLGVHWPTDVVAGYAAGLVWLIACIQRLELRQKYNSLGKHLQQEPEASNKMLELTPETGYVFSS